MQSVNVGSVGNLATFCRAIWFFNLMSFHVFCLKMKDHFQLQSEMLSRMHYKKAPRSLPMCSFMDRENTGKSSSLAALETIFTPKYCFTRPVGSASQFVMQGIINKKVAVLQDLRPGSLRLSWDSMLVWLEGGPITISQPRNQASEDLVYTGRAPVFISSAEKFRITMQECLKQGLEDPASQNAMLDARFRYFAYTRERPQGQMVHCPPCGPCFSEWLQANLGLVRFAEWQGSFSKFAISNKCLIFCKEAKCGCIQFICGQVKLSSPAFAFLVFVSARLVGIRRLHLENLMMTS